MILGFGLWFGLNFKPGSYPDAEHYDIDASEDDLLTAIRTFKHNSPRYNVPISTGLSDGQDGYWYFIYFYLPETDQIILTWTRPIDKTHTTFALVSVNGGSEIGNWKQLNRKELGKEGTNKIKEEFEMRILNKIKQLIEK